MFSMRNYAIEINLIAFAVNITGTLKAICLAWSRLTMWLRSNNWGKGSHTMISRNWRHSEKGYKGRTDSQAALRNHAPLFPKWVILKLQIILINEIGLLQASVINTNTLKWFPTCSCLKLLIYLYHIATFIYFHCTDD